MSLETTQAWWVAEAIDDYQSSVIACTAGMGSGKTDGGSDWLLDCVDVNYECPFYAFMEPTYQKVMDTAIPTMQRVLQRYGRAEDWHYKVIKSPHPKIIFKDIRWNPEVHFISAEKPDRIAAVQYTCALEDEAGVNKVAARRNLRTRLYRQSNARKQQFMVMGAPQGINAFAEEFDSETLDGWDTSHSRDHILRREVEGVIVQKRRFIIHTDDNPFVPRQYIIELQDTYGHNPMLIQSYRFGRFCPLSERAAFSNYMPQKHDVEGFEPDPYLDIILKWDFNFNPLAWVASQGFVRDYPQRHKTYVALHEANEGAHNLDDACVEFAFKFPPERFGETPIYVYGDRSGHSDSHKINGSDFDNVKQYLNNLGFRHVFIKATKSVVPEAASVEALNKMFFNGSYLVHKRCKMLRRGLLATQWQDRARKLEKPDGETHTHHPDAVKYWAWQERRTLMQLKRITGKN